MKNKRCSVLLGLFVVHLRCSSSLLAFGGSRSKYSARLGFVESAKNRRATLKQLQATRMPLPGLEFSSPGGEDGILSCQAAVAMGVDDLRVIDVEVGAPGPGEVRLKVVANALCHTDIYTLEGSDPEGLFPSILGHEAGAVVESVGKGVTSVVPGDKVVPCYTPQCREAACIFCASPKTNLCPKIRATQGKGVMPDGTTRFRLANSKEPVHHFMGTSTFSEYTVVAEISCAKVSATANLETVCMLGCGVSTGWGAVWKTTNVEPSSSVAVFGLGAVGLAVIQAAKVRGATKIVAIDVNPGKFAAAEAMGATCTLDPTSLPEGTSVQNALASAPFDMLWGVDYTFDCTGNVAVMRSALECAHRGCTFVAFR